MPVKPLRVLLAPVLRTEGWTSIDLLRDNYVAALTSRADAVELHEVLPDERFAGSRMAKRLLRDIYFPALIRSEAGAWSNGSGKPVLHVIDHSYGHLCDAWHPSVITVNDLNHFTAPALKGFALRRWRQRAGSMRKADHIVAISGQLAMEVREHVGIPAAQITVAHYGIDHAVFRPMAEEEAAALAPDAARLRKLGSMLILNIGSNIPRKNMPALLQALSLLKTEHHLPVKLIKVGHRLREDGFGPLIAKLGLDNDVIDTGSIPPAQVSAICNLCDVLAFPTQYEGFGRPTIEAQACGLPCVLGDSSCMREIGGAEAALYHEPSDVEAMTAALADVLTQSSTRERLRAAGFRNTRRFSWARHADALIEAYGKAVAAHSN